MVAAFWVKLKLENVHTAIYAGNEFSEHEDLLKPKLRAAGGEGVRFRPNAGIIMRSTLEKSMASCNAGPTLPIRGRCRY